jgi:competence protein ComEA
MFYIPFHFQKDRAYSLNLNLIYEIEGNVKNPGFYSYNCDKFILMSDALERAGWTNKNSVLFPRELLLAPVPQGSKMTVNSVIKIGLLEPEKFILFFIPFDLNRVSENQLNAIPGIGEKISQNIVQYRESTGFFKSLDEIKNVNGIGDVLYEKIKNYFFVNKKVADNR